MAKATATRKRTVAKAAPSDAAANPKTMKSAPLAASGPAPTTAETPSVAVPKPAAGPVRRRKAASATQANSADKASKEVWTMNYDKMMELNKEGFEAAMASGKIAAEGWGQVAQQWMTFFKAQTEEGLAASRAMIECKDPAQLIDAQAERTRKVVADWVSETAKVSEMSTKVAADVFAPVNQRLNDSFEFWKKNAA